jgi:hypothetical protein
MLFSDYGEFLRLTRPLPVEHKQKIVDVLPSEEKRNLRRDFVINGWESIVYKNEIASSAERIKKVFNKDPLRIRSLALRGNDIKVPSAFWYTFVEETKHIPRKYMTPFVGGIEVVMDPDDPQYVVFKRKASHEQE